jgi:hypothetical protein
MSARVNHIGKQSFVVVVKINHDASLEFGVSVENSAASSFKTLTISDRLTPSLWAASHKRRTIDPNVSCQSIS